MATSPRVEVEWDMPAEFEGAAASYWKRVYPLLKASGQLKDEDYHSVCRMCELHELANQARTEIQAEGLTIATVGDAGQERRVKHPAVDCYTRFTAELFKLEQRFGMSPKARSVGARTGVSDRRKKVLGCVT